MLELDVIVLGLLALSSLALIGHIRARRDRAVRMQRMAEKLRVAVLRETDEVIETAEVA
jgi:hypothetical protein